MIRAFEGVSPRIAESAFVEESASVIGDVVIGDESSIWFHTVIRADMHHIRIGKRTNIQDLCCLHVRYKAGATILGNGVTVGHHVILHACTIADRVLVGMGAIVMDGVEIGEDCLIGAGALVTPGTIVPPRSLVLGSPARIQRSVTRDEMDLIADAAMRYVEYTRKYKQA